MPTPRLHWRTALRDAEAAVSGPELTFLIGAGASISSGAPTTPQVSEALRTNNPHRLHDAATTRANCHTITGHEKSVAIAPLFRDVRPYVGYRCLAALGAHKRVNVLNLNWDFCVEDACRLLDIPWKSASAGDRKLSVSSIDSLPSGRGVYCLHLHGSLHGKHAIRFGEHETFVFPKPTKRFVQKRLAQHPLVVFGTTLVGDADMLDLLRGSPSGAPAPMPAWVFVRGEFDARKGPAVLSLLEARGSLGNLVEDFDVDFDQAMLALLAATNGRRYENLRDQAAFRVPTLDAVLWPSPSVLRRALDAPVVVIAGEPYLGKTTAAHLLAHIRHCLHGCQVFYAEGASCSGALGTASRLTEPSLVLLEDPFGSGVADMRDDTAFLNLASRVDGKHLRVVITTRRSVWDRAISRGTPLPNALVLPAGEPFYEQDDLMSYARRVGAHGMDVSHRILGGDLVTPHAVVTAMRGKQSKRDASEIVEEKFATLKIDPAAARLAMLLNLQEYHNRPESLVSLCQLAGVSADTPPEFVVSLIVDGTAYPRHRHPTDREAAHLAVESAETSRLLDDLGFSAPWIARALSVRRTLLAARHGTLDNAAWFEASPEEAREFASQAILVQPSPGLALTSIPMKVMDFWSRCELVFEVARVWHSACDPFARKWLRDLLSEASGLGTYALLEASLYLQEGTAPELWDHLRSAVHSILDSVEGRDAAALVLDALCWRTPPPERLAVADIVARLGAPNVGDQLTAARVFAALYHPSGYAALFRGPPTADNIAGSLSRGVAEHFVRMMEWHFLHQCRARALLARRPYAAFESLWLARSFHPNACAPALDVYEAVISRLLELGAPPGWIAHFCVNAAFAMGAEALLDTACSVIDGMACCDVGVATAALTFDGSGRWRNAVSKLLKRGGFECLLDVAFASRVSARPTVWGCVLDGNRFRFCDDIPARLVLLGFQWKSPERAGAADWRALVEVLDKDQRADRRLHLRREFLLPWALRGVTTQDCAACNAGLAPRPGDDGDRSNVNKGSTENTI